jgi:hypothetical protein
MGERQMASILTRGTLSTKDLEGWLSEVFIPVEPSELFIRRLRTRLLKVRGNSVFSLWTFLGVLAMVLMLIITSMGIALRILLLIASLFGLIERRNKSSGKTPLPAT